VIQLGVTIIMSVVRSDAPNQESDRGRSFPGGSPRLLQGT
jgi:hypothetical protein